MSTDTAARSDVDALLALNRDYIHSVQHGDVRRFDEILAEDFLCSNPDGTARRQKRIPRTDRATRDDQRPHGAGCSSAYSRRCGNYPRTHQLHHR